MKTALHSRHCLLGAKMAPFAGWEMPIQYKSILAEHQAVRQAVGLFDVSHMGRIKVNGPDAEKCLDFLSTNRISGKLAGSATYTVWCDEKGGSVDDVIVYRIDDAHFFIIVNASNRQKDLEHLQKYAKNYQVEIEDCFEGTGILALQGPLALEVMRIGFAEAEFIKPMHFIELNKEDPLILSRTGYTGAGGFELYGSNDQIVSLWDRLIECGQPFGIQPIGLGARDTLRLEMGFALYGHELSDTIAPNESVSAWTVKWDKPDFLGKEALLQLENSFAKRSALGIKLLDPGIARQGYSVFKADKRIGEVTSGTFSPTLNEAIALILVDTPLQIGEQVNVQIREKMCRAQVVQLPFVRKKA